MNYHLIKKDDINNGDGLRVTLFVAGCNHKCKECQNPHTWDKTGGIPFNNKTLHILLKEFSKEYISGITFSGGDPLYEENAGTILDIIKSLKMFPDKDIWVYTGFTYEELIASNNPIYLEILNNIDVLVDGRYEKDLRDVTLKWRGSSNQRVIDVQKTLLHKRIVLWCD